MIKRLRLKLICINMALVVLMLLIIFTLAYQFTAADLIKTEEAALKAAASAKKDPWASGSPAGAISCFTLKRNPWGMLIAVGNGAYDLSDMQILTDIYVQASECGSRTGVLESYGLRFFRHDGPEGAVFAFTEVATVRNTLSGLVQTFLLIGAASLLGFLGISILLARWAVKPVAEAWQQQQQFIADASHELKTPLTVILTNAELLQSPEHPEGEKSRFAENILTMSRQMRGLVESLLQLARADNGQIRNTQTRLDFSAVAEEAALPFEPAYFEQGMELLTRIEPGICVMGNEAYLRQIVEILLDNGLKYAASTGPVTLALARSGRGKCLLTVVTPGQPLTAQECRDIFKRFYRQDQARTDRDSYGLGLSIAERIAREHGGRIWAEGIQGGNAFYVNLPVAVKGEEEA